MLTEAILSEIIVIDNGKATLKLLPNDLALLAKACLIARESVPELDNEQLAVTFGAFSAMFKAAALACSCHGWMPAEFQERAARQVERMIGWEEGQTVF